MYYILKLYFNTHNNEKHEKNMYLDFDIKNQFKI